jgi:hypothetical protein
MIRDAILSHFMLKTTLKTIQNMQKEQKKKIFPLQKLFPWSIKKILPQ